MRDTQRLPQVIDPMKLADRGSSLSGALPLAPMERLNAIHAQPEGDVQFELDFSTDAMGGRFIRGSAKTKLRLVCQRCLEDYDEEVEIDVNLAPVLMEGEGKMASSDVEELVTGGKPVELSSLIEDEILLSLPTIPNHQTDCTRGY